MTGARHRWRPGKAGVRPVKLPPPLESAEQEAYVQWWRYEHPTVLLFAVPNGTFLFGNGEQRALQMVRLKKQGLVPGVPDLVCLEYRFTVEMKRQTGGRLSDEQIALHGHLRKIGWDVVVAEGAESAIRLTRALLSARATTPSSLGPPTRPSRA